jgi:sugar lactone lactonase YvrE
MQSPVEGFPNSQVNNLLRANDMSPSLSIVLAARARLGECPVWQAVGQRLYWVDVYNHRVHQFDSATGKDCYFDTGDVVSAIALAGTDRLLIALSDRLAWLHLPAGEVEIIHRIEFPHPVGTRLNDGKCDAQGRFWIGSCSDHPGQAALYRYDPDGSLHTMETGLTIANGLAWSPDGSTFYLTDSAQHKIFAYDYLAETGSIVNRRTLIDLSAEAVEPDGLTIDINGNLWSALWDGWCVACFAASGQELSRIQLPIPRPTSVTFGGPDLTNLYITSASVGLSQKEIQKCHTAGDVFCLAAVGQGMPTQSFGPNRS